MNGFINFNLGDMGTDYFYEIFVREVSEAGVDWGFGNGIPIVKIPSPLKWTRSGMYHHVTLVPVELALQLLHWGGSDHFMPIRDGEVGLWYSDPRREGVWVTPNNREIRPLFHEDLIPAGVDPQKFVFCDNPQEIGWQFVPCLKIKTPDALMYFWKNALRHDIQKGWGFFDPPVQNTRHTPGGQA